MISKEEIEELKSLLFKDQLTQHGKRKLIEYIEQLENKVREVEAQRNELATELSENEDDKQKLIDKLEARRKQNNDRYGMAIDNDEFPEMHEYSGQVKEDDYILKILKGEKQ